MKKKLLISLLVILFSLNYNTFAKTMKDLPYHHLPDGTFRNPEGSPKRDENIKWSFRTFNKEKKKLKIEFPPDHVIKKEKVLENLEKYKNDNYVAWIGHATFLIKLGNSTIITDPLFSKNAGPLIFGPKRYVGSAIKLNEIPETNLILLTHNHYDHLDYSTVKQIKNKVKMFFVPYGVANHLKGWGVRQESIIELNWDESANFNGIEIVCLPARHFSGRGPLNRNSTLWCSWAIKSEYGKIYFSGDSGYGKHFKAIGEMHGPFDLSFLDCGQYNVAWKYSHMIPEEAVRASKDLVSDFFMPIHWGAFTLSTHPWEEPVNRALNHAKKTNQNIVAPKLGQIIFLDDLDNNNIDWWNNN